ncbi:MAG: MFS transporter [Oscillospiraceae bacterium]|nr:MFS transporter [Oscillospiraceae bacterium]
MALKPTTSNPAVGMGLSKAFHCHYSWIIMISAFLILVACLGIGCNSLQIFIVTLADVYGVPIPTITGGLALQYFMLFLFTPVAGRVLYKNDVRKVVMILAVLQFIGWMILPLTNTLAMYYVSMVILGATSGFYSFMIAPTLINAWFAKSAGTALGITVCGTTIGSGLFQTLGGRMIAVHNYKYSLIVLGIVMILIQLIVNGLLVRSKPSDIGMMPYGYHKLTEEDKLNAQKDLQSGYTRKEAGKMFTYYLIMIYVIVLICGVVITTQVATWAQAECGFTVAQAGAISGVVWWCGGVVGNLITGVVTDKVNVAVGVTISVGLGIIGLIIFASGACAGRFGLAMAGGVLFGFLTTMIDMAAPLLTRKVFGLKDYTRVFSLVAMFVPLCSCSIGMMGYPRIFMKTGSYTSVFIIGICGALISTVLLFILNAKANKFEAARAAEMEANAPAAAADVVESTIDE